MRPLSQIVARHCAALGTLLMLCGRPGNVAIGDEAPSGVMLMDRSVQAPIVIGHRGASGYLPEHTLESAALAHAFEADYIEQDCVISRDGVPVVLHDLVLDDVTDVAGKFPDRRREDGHWHVCDFDLGELRQLQLTERRSPGRAWKDRGTRFPLEAGSFRISTLAEHLTLIQGLNQSRGRTAGVYVEVKDPTAHRAAGLDASTAVLAVLTEFGYDAADSPIFVQCFDRDEVIRIRKELKSPLPLIWLLDKSPSSDDIKAAATFCDGLGVRLQLVVADAVMGAPVVTSLVRDAHHLGLQVHVWTFRTDALPEFAGSSDELLEWLTVVAGVDGVFSDQPDVVVRWRDSRLAKSNEPNPFRLLNTRTQP